MKTPGNHLRRSLFSFALLVLIHCSFSGCKKTDNSYNSSPSGGGGTGTPPANEVWIQNMAFNPSSITVAVNTTIKWTNKDAITHTVTSTNGAFDSGNVPSGQTFSRQFTTAGSFPYHCTIHPSMTGTVTVQ